MRHYSIAFLLLLCPLALFAQNKSRSSSFSFSIAKEVKPPILNVDESSIRFEDASSNNAIDASEKNYIKFTVSNNGYGDAVNCVARVRIEGTSDDIKTQNVYLPTIGVGKKVDVTLPLISGINTKDGSVVVSVSVDEPNGFGADPFSLCINTKSFVPPMLKITDYAVTGTSGTLQKKSMFNLQLLLQNTNYGQAEDVRVSVKFPEGIFVLDGEQNKTYTTLDAGQSRSLDFSLIANNNYNQSSIPIVVTIKEKHGRYSENKTINLQFNQSLSSHKINVDEVATASLAAIEIASLSSDVDKVPISGKRNEDVIVVIVANENYQNDAIVDYARNDGVVFKEYCEKTLGIPDKNIKLYQDATLNNIISAVSWVKAAANAYKGDSKVIFYYAGHGVPDEGSRGAYLLPVDGDGRNPKVSGYSLDLLYKELAGCPTQSTLVLLDACFSGACRDGKMLASARGVAIAPRASNPYGKLVVLSAATGEQTANKFDKEKHGLFTYYLLKKLKESSGSVNLGELSDYVRDKVMKESVLSNSKSQTPTVLAGTEVSESWRNIQF